jgi:2-polyprenyl-3-methyl-5-hydroxy-6-metoxy-1,4-benzoquinol methylase
MSCCQCQGIATSFDEKYVAKKLKEYRKKGPKQTTRQLIEVLRAQGVQGNTLLDIGGGLGDIQHELLRAGVSQVINCDAASAYQGACRQEAERLGHAERIRYLPGNFVELAREIFATDIVTLDRVICCYDDMPSLVNLSAQKAKKLYGIVYPRDTWWIRAAIRMANFYSHWVERNPMRVFVHSSQAVEAIIHNNGLELIFLREMGPWQVLVYRRAL